MATNKKRINITLSKDLERGVLLLAKRDQVPSATKASELVRLALEIEEDVVWDSIASSRDSSQTASISHKNAWA